MSKRLKPVNEEEDEFVPIKSSIETSLAKKERFVSYKDIFGEKFIKTVISGMSEIDSQKMHKDVLNSIVEYLQYYENGPPPALVRYVVTSLKVDESV